IGTTTPVSYDDSGLAPSTAYTYEIAAVDAAGNVGPSMAATFTTLEASPPTVTGPLVGLAATGQLGTTNVPLLVTWSADDVSGVASIELQQSKNGSSWTAVALPTPTATSVTLWRAAGNKYRYRVRATDTLANVSVWAAGPTVTVSAKQEGNASISYAGTW